MTRFTHQLHPSLTWVLNELDGSALGQALMDRLTDLLASTAFSVIPDYEQALRAHLWVLRRARDKGFMLTASGYLKLVDVRELMMTLPEMMELSRNVGRERDARRVLCFREYLQDVRLLRKYKGTLLTSRLGKVVAADPAVLWQHLAGSLLKVKSEFGVSAIILILIHTATQQDEDIDMYVIARALTELGWHFRDGTSISVDEIRPIANYVWTAIGSIGEQSTIRPRWQRAPSPEAIRMICDALFTEVTSEEVT